MAAATFWATRPTFSAPSFSSVLLYILGSSDYLRARMACVVLSGATSLLREASGLLAKLVLHTTAFADLIVRAPGDEAKRLAWMVIPCIVFVLMTAPPAPVSSYIWAEFTAR